MTPDQLQFATGATAIHAQQIFEDVVAACTQYGISTHVQQLCFLAQAGHESGGLYYTEELANGTAYEGRTDLGNTQPGDGVRFKGRGLIQITGRSNYSILSRDLRVDFINDPQLLGGKNINVCTPVQLKNATLSAAWFWHRWNLNDIASLIDMNAPIDEGANLEHFKQITHKINGGYNGLPDRLSRYNKGLGYFMTA